MQNIDPSWMVAIITLGIAAVAAIAFKVTDHIHTRRQIPAATSSQLKGAE